MELKNKIEWNDLIEGGYYKIIYKDDEWNVQDEGYLDLFNVIKLTLQPRDWDRQENETPKNYRAYSVQSLAIFDGHIGILVEKIYKRYIKEIFKLSHDDLIFEIIKTWLEKDENINKPLLFARITNDQGEDYFQLHFKAIYDDIIQIIAEMSRFFTKTYEILPSSAIENAIMIEIPLIKDNA